MLCAFTHQSCFQKHIKSKSHCGFPQDPAQELGLFQRQMEGGSTNRYQKGFRATDLTNPCYTCGWGRRPWPESATSWWPHQPHGVRGPICLMGTQLLASWQQWAQDELKVTPDPWSRHTLSCSLRTEDDSGPNPACKSTPTNPHLVYFPKAYFVKWSEVTQSCPTLCNPMDCSLPGFSIHRIFQARVLEWVAISFSRGSSQPRNQTWVSCIAGRCFTLWATREANIL